MEIMFRKFDRNVQRDEAQKDEVQKGEVLGDRENSREFYTAWAEIPELTDGFVPAEDQKEELAAGQISEAGMKPVTMYSDWVVPGVYRVKVQLKALENVERLYLFTGRKQLREICSMKKGACLEGTYCQSVAEIIPRYHDKVWSVDHLFVSYCTKDPQAVHMECQAEPAPEVRRIFLCGDSTVTDQSGEIPYHPGGCYAAWGQALPAFFDDRTAVENQAHCGLTTENFEKEGHLELVRRHLRPGDLCLFQFGHNDQKRPHLMADTGYRQYLLKFIEEVRKWGGIPVLVTPLGRNTWSDGKTYRDLLKDYAEEVKRLARETDTACIDLHGFSTNWIRHHGMERSRDYFHPDDYTHNNEYGAYLFGKFVAEELGTIFPEMGIRKKEGVSFKPPFHVWDGLSGAGYQKSAAGEKEEFDRMEKSTAALFQAVHKARENGKERE